MAVYTSVNREELTAFLDRYDLGTLDRFEGIAQGVSNTNYHLFTDKGRYILTLFEPHRVKEEELSFFLSYASHMADSAIPCARAIADRDGNLYASLADRPTAIMSFCEGEHPAEVSADLCREAGGLLARMHLAGEAFKMRSDNIYGLAKWQEWEGRLGEKLNDISFGLTDAVRGELLELERKWPKDLPSGAIHADLFPDNVFFKDGKVSGVIDFHFACTDFLAYDLAIVINAWCFDKENSFEQVRYDALMEAYCAVRPLDDKEQEALPTLLRAAAIRFLLSRSEELLSHNEGDLITPHNPHDFIRRLEFFQDE